MRRKWLIITLTIVFVSALLPLSYLLAEPNLVTNGDFSDGSTGWDFDCDPGGCVNFDGNTAEIISSAAGGYTNLRQYLIPTSCKDLTLCFDVQRTDAGTDPDSKIRVGFLLWDDDGLIEQAHHDYGNASENFPVGTWHENNCLRLSEVWEPWHGDLPDFTKVGIKFFMGYYAGAALFDNIRLYCPAAESEPEPWVRTMPMTCWQVWINEDNNFQFIFWYPYKDKNFVKIYDMEGNMVFETDLPWHDPNLIVDLPDGYYMVRTYHGEEMIQEFLIGKPGPEM